MLSTQLVIVGAGPAGMMAALQASQNQKKVILFDKQISPGTKLLLTGNGRCNLTNAMPMEHWDSMIFRNHAFLRSAFRAFSNQDLMSWMEAKGLTLVEEEHGRVYPASHSAKAVLEVLKKALLQQNVQFIQNRITHLCIQDKTISGLMDASGKTWDAKAVILACGGKSYPQTGSNGDGYSLAQQAGHSLVTPRPSLCSLNLLQKPFAQLSGISLPQVRVKLMNASGYLYGEQTGSVLFSHLGITGPAVINLSAFLPVQADDKLWIVIDFLPHFSAEQLCDAWARVKERTKIQDWLEKECSFPRRFCQWLSAAYDFCLSLPVNQWSKKEKTLAASWLKQSSFELTGDFSFQEAMVTAGGISVKEIRPNTMESRLIKGLFFAGEIMDMDGLTGGFNLQIAFSTGYLAGSSACQ